MTRDLRKYAQQTNFRLAVGFLALLFILGSGLIWVIYGPQAALLGLVCMLFGLVPIIMIIVVFWGLELLMRRTREED